MEIHISDQGTINIINYILKTLPEAIAETTKETADTVKELVVGRTPVGVTAHPGQAKRSWSNMTYVQGGYSFSSDVAYIGPLSYGCDKGKKPWPNAGKRTVESNGKIFSSRVVDNKGQGIVDPILNDRELHEKIATYLGKAILKIVEKGYAH